MIRNNTFLRQVVFVALAAISVGAVHSVANASNIYLDADGGSDSNLGTSPDQAWASLEKASSFSFAPGDRLLLQRGDVFAGELNLDGISGTVASPVVVSAYGSGDLPLIDAAGYSAGVDISNSANIHLEFLAITADGGEPVDGSSITDRYGVYIEDSVGCELSDLHVYNIFAYVSRVASSESQSGRNPTSNMGRAIRLEDVSDTIVKNCRIERNGHTAIFMRRSPNCQILDNRFKDIGGPGIVPNRCDDLVVRGNVIDASGSYVDPRMHGRGSGIWPINCTRVLIEKNSFMHARGRYDSCGVHLDHNNQDAIVQYNLSMDNAGGFIEILGGNRNCAYRYNISINDGVREAIPGEASGIGYTIEATGHNNPERNGPYDCYIYNNTIFVKGDQPCRFRVDQHTEGLLVANNLFYAEGPAENATPNYISVIPPAQVGRVVWSNNFYQRGGIFPEGFQFQDDSPIYGNPNLANPGGLTPEDYIPLAGSLVEGRGIDIPLIPGDLIGLRIGLEVSADFFGNPIVGLPDIGAVELGGGTSTAPGAAFLDVPQLVDGVSAEMTAVEGDAGDEYYFNELTGSFGGHDSGWQTGAHFLDTGLLPNMTYSYEVSVRNDAGLVGKPSVVSFVMSPKRSPFLNHVILDEDFSSMPNPANTSSPFPVNTWYLDDSSSWSGESSVESVAETGGMLRLGWGADEVLLQYICDQTLDSSRDYEFSGDWKIGTVLENHLGFIVGFGEYDPTTGELLRRLKEETIGELATPVVDQSGAFSLTITSSELVAAGVSSASRIGLFLHCDDDGVLSQEGDTRNDVYLVDNLNLLFSGDGVDRDGDGILDTVELMVGLDPANRADGTEDLDQDGITNSDEYLLGTPLNQVNGGVKMGMVGSELGPLPIIQGDDLLEDRVYILEYKSSLEGLDKWRAVDAVNGSIEVGQGNYIFGPLNENEEGFYRVRVEWN